MSTFVAGSIGFDGLFVIKPDGRMYIQTGVGNLGTESMSDTNRVAAEMMGMPWEKVELTWGDTAQEPAVVLRVRRQPDDARDDARGARGGDRRASRSCRRSPRSRSAASPKTTWSRTSAWRRKGGGAGMTLAQAAQKAIELGGTYDGHELPKDINAYTEAVGDGAGRAGPDGRRARQLPARRSDVLLVRRRLRRSRSRRRNRQVRHRSTTWRSPTSGTVIHPAALGGQVLGRSMLGIGHAIGQKWVYDQHYGVPLAKRFYQNKPPTILDVPQKMKWAALDIPDPETPVGARGIGEPPVAAGCCAMLNALSDAVGDEIFRRAPVNLDTILTSLEAGRPMQERLTAHI